MHCHRILNRARSGKVIEEKPKAKQKKGRRADTTKVESSTQREYKIGWRVKVELLIPECEEAVAVKGPELWKPKFTKVAFQKLSAGFGFP